MQWEKSIHNSIADVGLSWNKLENPAKPVSKVWRHTLLWIVGGDEEAG